MIYGNYEAKLEIMKQFIFSNYSHLMLLIKKKLGNYEAIYELFAFLSKIKFKQKNYYSNYEAIN